MSISENKSLDLIAYYALRQCIGPGISLTLVGESSPLRGDAFLDGKVLVFDSPGKGVFHFADLSWENLGQEYDQLKLVCGSKIEAFQSGEYSFPRKTNKLSVLDY